MKIEPGQWWVQNEYEEPEEHCIRRMVKIESHHGANYEGIIIDIDDEDLIYDEGAAIWRDTAIGSLYIRDECHLATEEENKARRTAVRQYCDELMGVVGE